MLTKEIFNYANAINGYSKIVVFELRRQNYDTGLRKWRSVVSWTNFLVEKLYENITEINTNYMEFDLRLLLTPMENIIVAQENGDYLLMADMIELQFLPIIEQIVHMFVTDEVSNEDVEERITENTRLIACFDEELAKNIRNNYQLDEGYYLEYTSGGDVTLRIEKDGRNFYVAGNNSLYFEGYLFADKYYKPSKSKYIVAGLGMGFGISSLAEKDCEQIDVFESDINIIRAVCQYGNLPKMYCEWKTLRIHYDPDFTKFVRAQEMADFDNTEIIIYQPFIKNITNPSIRQKFEELFLVDSSIRNQEGLMYSNFRVNERLIDKNVDELKDKFEGKDVYIIAAGPSLDNNIELLKNKPLNSVILATGTVFKKLINLGIDIDYVVVSDSNVRVRSQIIGMEREKAGLIILSTASKHFADTYCGEKYIAYQKDYELSQKVAKEKGNMLYASGGSVTTLALDIAINLCAKRIIFLGLDLAYTNNLAHATGTSRREHKGTEGLTPVESVDGGVVYANNSFIMYRHWIENRIKDVNIPIIDATEGGAKIKGTMICNLAEILQG